MGSFILAFKRDETKESTFKTNKRFCNCFYIFLKNSKFKSRCTETFQGFVSTISISMLTEKLPVDRKPEIPGSLHILIKSVVHVYETSNWV